MVLNYCFYDFDVWEIFDNVKYAKDVHAKLLKKICEDYSLEKQELIEIGTLTQNDVDERAKAYMVKKTPSLVILFVWDANLTDVNVLIVTIESPVEVYDYIYEEKMRLIQLGEKIEFIWEITTWDDMDYCDHLSSTTKSSFVYDKNLRRVVVE